MKHILFLSLLAVLAIGSVAAASGGDRTASPAKDCGEIAFTPNSDDIASDITARGVSCKTARGFVRAAGGRPGKTFRGFACTRRTLETALPSWRYRCVKGGRVIRWVKT